MYSVPKIFERLFDVDIPGRQRVLNLACPLKTPLDKHLTPANAILATSDMVALYPSMLHQSGMEVLRETLDKRKIYCCWNIIVVEK